MITESAAVAAMILIFIAGFMWGRIQQHHSDSNKFKPGVFYNADLRLTELVLEDACTIWVPWGPYKGHAVDCGYDLNGDLVGIKIWDDVRSCKSLQINPTKYAGEVKWT